MGALYRRPSGLRTYRWASSTAVHRGRRRSTGTECSPSRTARRNADISRCAHVPHCSRGSATSQRTLSVAERTRMQGEEQWRTCSKSVFTGCRQEIAQCVRSGSEPAGRTITKNATSTRKTVIFTLSYFSVETHTTLLRTL